jgi:two-component system, NtrC family, sensor kinase
MHRLEHFSVDDLVRCSDALRTIGAGATSMVEVAGRTTTHLYEHLVDDDGRPACALVRLYKTHQLGGLDDQRRHFAEQAARDVLHPRTRCLTLLATSGTYPTWNDPRRSVSHQAIPLTSEAALERLPMIAGLVRQLGLEPATVVAPDPEAHLALHHGEYKVFYVPEARGNALVPDQDDFVVPYGIRSVVGVGGVLPSGDLFTVIFFTTVPVSVAVADLLRSLALAVKAALVPFTFSVFERASGTAGR